MSLHPWKYAETPGDKLVAHNLTVWLINTGWTGGGYGDGDRISIKHTRALVNTVIDGKLDNVLAQT